MIYRVKCPECGYEADVDTDRNDGGWVDVESCMCAKCLVNTVIIKDD